MSVSLNKGDRVELSKDSRVNAVSVCLGWDTAKYDDDGDFDLDASAFVIGRNGMTRRDEDFIFYNNLQLQDFFLLSPDLQHIYSKLLHFPCYMNP